MRQKAILLSEDRKTSVVLASVETEEKLIGIVTHYYPKIKVGVIELSDNLNVGDKIRVKDEKNDFEQIINSIQVEHKNIESARKGEVVGVEFEKPVKENSKVYRINS